MFMGFGYKRFNECDYKKAYYNFYAAYLLDVSEEQKAVAFYQSNISDSCKTFRFLGNQNYEYGNYKKARYYYQKVVFFNDNDTICIKKSKLCEEKIRNNPPINELSMIYVNSGKYIMGNKKARFCEKHEHEVFISGLYVDMYEVTNQQYANFLNDLRIPLKKAKLFIDLDDNDCQIYYKNDFYFVKNGKNQFPVVEVNWYGANAYARHYGKRLPTEAEWEYIAKYFKTGLNKNNGILSAVGCGKPNKLGIYDLYGNVREWCDDYYWENFYQTSPKKNPRTISDSDKKVVRGAAFNTIRYRTYSRDCELPFETSSNLGFRCVKDAD